MNKKIPEINILRALLAWWVVGDHLLGFSGYGINDLNGILKIIREGSLAVDVFIIISGFVISSLIISEKDDTYLSYIKRRFLRLYPLFIVCTLISIIILPQTISAMRSFEPTTGLTNFINICVIDLENLNYHLLTKSIMFHGLVPNEILYNSSSSFLAPAWSVSLEWQFYLVAPILIIGLNNLWLKRFNSSVNIIYTVLSLMLISIFIYVNYHTTWSFNHPAFLPLKAIYFLIGIVSFLFYKTDLKKQESNVFNLFMLGVIVASVYGNIIPMIIWALTILYIKNNSSYKVGRLQKNVINNKYLQWLGEISYSTYLIHVIIIYLVQIALNKLEITADNLITKKVLLIYCTLTVIPLTLIFSGLSYKYLELPSIRFGNKFKNQN